MSFNHHLQQGSYGSHSRNNGKPSNQQSSIESMFQGLIPGSGNGGDSGMSMFSSSASNPSGLNLSTRGTMGMASSSGRGGDSLNANLSDELKRLQQLHQLTSSQNSSNHNQLMAMQSLLGNSNQPSLGLNSFSNSSSFGGGGGGLSQRDAAAYLLMSQQQQPFQQQQNQLQQHLGGGFSSAAAQLAAAKASLPSPSMLAGRTPTGTLGLNPSRGGPGAIEPFPEKLHRMLLEVEATGRSDIISFVDDGRAFAIHKPNEFFKSIVPLYFRQSRLSSFKRQLNLYGFELISNGPSRGAYFHELFQKDKPHLCRRMRRVAVKVSAKKKADEGEDKTDGDGGRGSEE